MAAGERLFCFLDRLFGKVVCRAFCLLALQQGISPRRPFQACIFMFFLVPCYTRFVFSSGLKGFLLSFLAVSLSMRVFYPVAKGRLDLCKKVFPAV